jgi:orotate phosphoribosyltransferase
MGEFKTGGQIAALGRFYAACIAEHMNAGALPKDVNVIFGPAYKGIPLAVITAAALATDYEKDVSYAFNRKEAKDHGEGGSIVGAKLKDGDKLLVIDDVITAGTAIREILPMLKSAAKLEISALVIAVDRMERGQGSQSAVEELKTELGIKVFPLVTVRDILSELRGREINCERILTEERAERLAEYMEMYCLR